MVNGEDAATAGDSTKPSQRVTKTIEELQMWKRHLVLTDKQFKGYVASTEREHLQPPCAALIMAARVACAPACGVAALFDLQM